VRVRPALYFSNFDGRLVTTTAIPNRAVFRSQEVCEIAEVQAYVLRSWEAEFPDLGMSKSADGPRVYRRADVERVLRLKHLLFVDGLTLAGARKQLALEGTATSEPSDEGEAVVDADVASMLDQSLRRGLRDVRQGLQWMLGVLNGGAPRTNGARQAAKPPARKVKSTPAAKPVKSKAASRAAGKSVKKAKPVKTAKKAGKKKR
jgi:DNA-binding transcriptional MerR regulator